MSTYSEKLKDPRWQKKRLEIMQRDGFKCRGCGAEDKPLHIHHCHYEKGDPWQTHERFLMTLCERCHKYRGFFEDVARLKLGEIFRGLECGPESDELKEFCITVCELAEGRKAYSK